MASTGASAVDEDQTPWTGHRVVGLGERVAGRNGGSGGDRALRTEQSDDLYRSLELGTSWSSAWLWYVQYPTGVRMEVSSCLSQSRHLTRTARGSHPWI